MRLFSRDSFSLQAALALLFSLLTACSPEQTETKKNPDQNHNSQNQAQPPNVHHPRFDWFEYSGRDSAYNNLSAGEENYLNPIIMGFHPDPSITRAGNDYYLVNSSFSYFPGVPVFHSKDLVNWRQIGHVLNRPSQLKLDGLGISRGIFAPTIRFHDGVFYMITTVVDGGGNFIVTATNPAGPWSDPVWLPEVGGIDPSLFFDDNGKAYITNNDGPIGEPLYEGHRAIWIREFDPENLKVVGEQKMIVNGGVDISKKPVWIEGPHLIKNKGAYYLIAAEGGTAVDHSQVVFKSDSVWGPYVPYENNPILTQRHLDPNRPHPVTSVGHVDFVKTQNDEWWAVFLGCRPYEGDFYNTGRETFLLPVSWEGEWPVILDGSKAVPYIHERPNLPRQQEPTITNSGNFVERDDFTGNSLAPYWQFIRTPYEKFHDLTSQPGSLMLQARPILLGDFKQPSFIGRAQQHLNSAASVAMHYRPAKAGDKAGISAFQNDEYYYLLSVARTADGDVVQLEKRAGSAPVVVASKPISLNATDPVFLKIESQGKNYSFYYATTPDEWIPLSENQDGTILSTRTAGGFVGAFYGLYAYSNN